MKKNRPTIPNKVYNLLWAISAGRCQFCNKILYQDLLTKKQVNAAYVAHIYDVNPKTHRYDENKSPKLEKDIGNLMLLCDEHHRLIDNEGEKDYSVKKLLVIKKNHEERVKKLTGIMNDKQSFMLLYSAPIGKHTFLISKQETENAMVRAGFYPAEDIPIVLSASDTEVKDFEKDFWRFHPQNLIRKYKRLVAYKVLHKEITQISVFAIAPQPLLVLLGVLLGDIKTTFIYPKNREVYPWGWINKKKGNDYEVIPPNIQNNQDSTIALKISISGDIENNRIRNVLGQDCIIWELRVSSIGNKFLTSPHQAKYFRGQVTYLFDKIKRTHIKATHLNVFPAMPAALAVEFGKAWMPKADLSLIIYDESREHKGFFKTIEIPESDPPL